MNCFLPYGTLLLCVLSLVVDTKYSLKKSVFSAGLLCAFFYGKISLFGLTILSTLLLMGLAFCHINEKKKSHKFLFLIIFLLTGALSLHIIPGFHNCLILNKVVLSKDAHPYTLYFNFDKILSALTLGVLLLPAQKGAILTKKICLLFPLCIASILALAFSLNYVAWEPKFPSISVLWGINNLLAVCFAEEMFFRGFIQKTLAQYIKNSWMPIAISALLFGIAHYQGGFSYMLLATYAGLFYGYSYRETNRILTPMLFHFSLNLIHFLLFTYPALRA